MAKRRKARSSFRRSGGYKKVRSHRRSSNGGSGLQDWAIGGAIYGVAREPIATMAEPLAKMLPVPDEYKDEAAMGIIDYLAYRFLGSHKLVKDAAKAGIATEAARVTSGMTAGMFSRQLGSNTSSGGYLYG